MATNFRNIGEDQRWSTRQTEIMETNQQNHQTGIQSMINRASPDSEQYTRKFIDSIYQSLNETKSLKDQRKTKSEMLQE